MTKDDRDTVKDLLGDFTGLIVEGVQGIAIGVVAIPVIMIVSFMDLCYSLADRIRS